MDELQRYGLLSIACLIVLCLALTFRDREHDEPLKPKSLTASIGGDHRPASRRSDSGGGGVPEPDADAEHAHPDPGAGAKPAIADAAADDTWTVASGDTLRKIARV